MKLLYRRPLATVLFIFFLCFGACALLGALFSLILGGVGVLALIGTVILAAVKKKWRTSALLIACLLSLTFSGFFGTFSLYANLTRLDAYGGKTYSVVGTVRDIKGQGEGSACFLLVIDKIGEEEEEGILYVTLDTKSDFTLQVSDVVHLSSVTLLPLSGRNTEEQLSLRAEGACAEAISAMPPQILGQTSSPYLRAVCLFSSWRDQLSLRLQERVDGELGALMSAMLLGKRELISPLLSRDFQRTGLVHILSISGFHFALLSGLLLRLLRKLGVHRRGAYLLTAAGAIAYMLLTGLPYCVVRAGIMILSLCLSSILFQRSDGITSLASSAALICLITPHAVYDYGFWLSVLATFGILVYGEWREKHRDREKKPLWKRLLLYVAESLAVTVSAIFATLPLCAIFFGETSLIAPIANLVLAPLLEGVLILSIPALLLPPPLLVAPLLSLYEDLLLRLLSLFSAPRGVLISLDYVSVKILLSLFLLSLVLVLLLRPFRPRVVLGALGAQLSLVLILLLTFYGLAASQNAVIYTKNDKNETVVLYSEGRAMLCDYSAGSYDAQVDAVTELQALRLTEYEGYLLSHYHRAHLKTLGELLPSLKIRHLYLPTPQSEEEETWYHTLLQMAEEAGVTCIRYDHDDPIVFGKLVFIPHKNAWVNGHAEGAFSVKTEKERLTYLGRAYQTQFHYGAADDVIAESTYIILGAHGAAVDEPLPYKRFSSDLQLILLPDQSILPDKLKQLLDERSIPYRAPGDREYILLDCS